LETEYIPLLLALAAGLFYACSAVLCKKALELGAGTIRSLVYSNIFMSMCFLPYPLLAGETIQFHDMQTGACLGLLFFLGQFFCFLALKNGEASLITPIMGSKPIFVAAFIVLHGLSEGEVSWETWVACGLSALAVALLCWPSKNSTLSWTGLFLALATAATFGLLDSLVPFFTHQSNPVNVLFFIFGSVGLFSLFLIPYTEGNFLKFRKKADRWMWASAIPMGGQAILMSMAIGLYHVPTEANIFYACRGLWAVLLIAWFGKKMMLSESSLSTSTFMRRGLGASLLIIGIWLTSFQ
jgi:drug/metabolite transporter (DMT)-like permease